MYDATDELDVLRIELVTKDNIRRLDTSNLNLITRKIRRKK